MATDLYGQEYLSYRDVARKLITIGASMPFYRLHLSDDNIITYTVDRNGTPEKVNVNYPGIYVIYRQIDGKLEALYSGHSNNDVGKRIYRFIKEIQNRSRPDENHPGAKKARHHGVKSTDEFYVKVMSKHDMPEFTNFRYDMDRVDECIAYLLKTKYNERLIYG